MNKNIIQSIFLCAMLLVAAACNNVDDEGQNAANHNDDTISSMSTGTPSSKYPHTKPIVIQKAKYEFRIVDGRGGGQQIAQAPSPKQPGATPAPEQAPPQQQEAQPPQQQQQQQQQPAQEAPQAGQQAAPAPKVGISAAETKVIELTNVERRRNGLPDLQADTSLSNVAREKSNDMQAKNYFSHTSPTYGSPFDMMRDFGISYRSAGENIAQGQQSPEEVVQAWMNSEGHRKNILSADFTHIGVGHTAQGNYWTQMFIKK